MKGSEEADGGHGARAARLHRPAVVSGALVHVSDAAVQPNLTRIAAVAMPTVGGGTTRESMMSNGGQNWTWKKF